MGAGVSPRFSFRNPTASACAQMRIEWIGRFLNPVHVQETLFCPGGNPLSIQCAPEPFKKSATTSLVSYVRLALSPVWPSFNNWSASHKASRTCVVV
jgi:hypothetical protein